MTLYKTFHDVRFNHLWLSAAHRLIIHRMCVFFLRNGLCWGTIPLPGHVTTYTSPEQGRPPSSRAHLSTHW